MTQIIESYTVEEVAKSVKLHPYTVRRLCREGKIPAFKFGGQWRFKKDVLDKWLEEQMNKKRGLGLKKKTKGG